jgi:hypothetical protein
MISSPQKPVGFLYKSLFLAAALSLGLAGVARADWKPTVELTPTENGILLSVNRHPAMRFDDIDAPWSFPGRPQIVADRLQNLIQRGFDPKSIVVKNTPQGSILLAGGSSLLTVTDSEAQNKRMTRQALAETWAKTLRNLLSMVPLNASPAQVVLPVGETRTINIGGASNGPISCVMQPEGVATGVINPETRQVVLSGVAPGSGSLTVTSGEDSITVPYSVKKYAGRVQNAFVAVTGNGPDRSDLHQIIDDAVERNLTLEPGATASISDSYQLPASIPPQGAVLTLPVSLTGDSYLPVKANASVRLLREEVGRTEPNLLFYSNDPEMLRKYYGVLYTGVIRANQAVRLLYHHQSAMNEPIRFTLQLKNGDTPARLQIIDGSASPQIDTFQIGRRAAAKFFPNWLNDSGYIQDLQPGETITLLNQRLTKDMTTSGIYHFVLLSGSSVTVQLRADPPDQIVDVRPSRPNPEVYPVTRKRFNETYSVGGRWSFIPFGREPILTHDSSHPLDGNYGVVYDLTLNLENTTDQRNDAEIVFDPAAGVAQGVFIVDGKMVQTGHLRPPQEFVLGDYPLAPGERRKVHILTMPLAGSNYPARFTVRPRYSIAKNTVAK